MTILLCDLIGTREQRGGIRVLERSQDLVGWIAATWRVLGVALRSEDAVLEVLGLVDVDEGIEAFVHPLVATLIESHDHREPGVAELMRGQREQILASIRVVIEDDGRILHAADGPGDGRGRRIRIVESPSPGEL